MVRPPALSGLRAESLMTSGHRLLDEHTNLGFRRLVQRGEGPRDRVHVGAFLASGVYDFAEAECDEVLFRFDVADVLAVLHVERQSPAHDRFERWRALADDAMQAFSNVPIRCGGIAELGEDGRVALLREHVSGLLPVITSTFPPVGSPRRPPGGPRGCAPRARSRLRCFRLRTRNTRPRLRPDTSRS